MDSEAELKSTVHHLRAMLRTVKTLNKGNAKGLVADALSEHLKGVTLADLGLAEVAPVEVPARAALPVRPSDPSAEHANAA